jgi:hypothetical protein
LAHWTTDVLAGLVMGAGTERLLRFVTGYGHPPACSLIEQKPRSTPTRRRR